MKHEAKPFQIWVPTHFRTRVRERIGSHIDVDKLVEEISTCIRHGLDRVRYAAPSPRFPEHRAIYQIRIGDLDWFVVADRHTGIPITLLPRENALYKPRFKASLIRLPGNKKRTSKRKPLGRRAARNAQDE